MLFKIISELIKKSVLGQIYELVRLHQLPP